MATSREPKFNDSDPYELDYQISLLEEIILNKSHSERLIQYRVDKMLAKNSYLTLSLLYARAHRLTDAHKMIRNEIVLLQSFLLQTDFYTKLKSFSQKIFDYEQLCILDDEEQDNSPSTHNAVKKKRKKRTYKFSYIHIKPYQANMDKPNPLDWIKKDTTIANQEYRERIRDEIAQCITNLVCMANRTTFVSTPIQEICHALISLIHLAGYLHGHHYGEVKREIAITTSIELMLIHEAELPACISDNLHLFFACSSYTLDEIVEKVNESINFIKPFNTLTNTNVVKMVKSTVSTAQSVATFSLSTFAKTVQLAIPKASTDEVKLSDGYLNQNNHQSNNK